MKKIAQQWKQSNGRINGSKGTKEASWCTLGLSHEGSVAGALSDWAFIMEEAYLGATRQHGWRSMPKANRHCHWRFGLDWRDALCPSLPWQAPSAVGTRQFDWRFPMALQIAITASGLGSYRHWVWRVAHWHQLGSCMHVKNCPML